MDIPTISSETMMHAFTQGLIEGDFFRSLIRKPSRDYNHMLKKTSEYINVEEAQTARRKEMPTKPPALTEKRPPINHQPPRGPRAKGARQHYEAKLHVVQHMATEWPRPKEKVWTLMFCSLHQSVSHNTRNCQGFAPFVSPTPRNYRCRSPSPNQRHRHQDAERREVRRSSEQPHHGDQPQTSHERARPSTREEKNRSNAARGEINIIVGGPTGGDSNRAQKSHARQLRIHAVGCSEEKANRPKISFGPRDLEGVEVPHDDALIIKAINRAELLPMTTSLYGFTGNEVLLVGQTRLAISLGEEPLRRTRATNFIVVDAPSAYNVILGHPALNEFRVVISTFCQKIKFSVEDQVGEVRGD
ncbi:uncharacterized protein LOC122010604 [Zingiber officinale]|uniref:uncharacterized protein LOC122010604 n=1 Tax=Zingiber officinale TaxID=94328 RepID=UPI001C4D3E85|nr:uncharacterized protein LOC122010604 [Zingiber officinale]